MQIYLLFSLLILLPGAISFSTPEFRRQFSYKPKEKITVYANELDSLKTQLNFEYYFLKFCQPPEMTNIEQNLGNSLLAESTQLTPYLVEMKMNTQCQQLCKMNLNAQDVENFAWMIDNEYYVNLVIDNLPAKYEVRYGRQTAPHIGFPLGYKTSKSSYFIYNHLKFKIEYVDAPHSDAGRIVGFTIEPKSIASSCEPDMKASEQNLKTQKLGAGVTVFFSYDVEFIQTNKPLSSRYEPYKLLGYLEIHAWSAFNSTFVILILTIVIFYTLRRALGLNQGLESRQQLERDLKWKELSRDVFRPPTKPLLLAVCIGTGIQIGAMFVLTLILFCLGFVTISRGSFLTVVLTFYALMGGFAGYCSARLYKMFGGSEWIKCAFWTSTLYPLINMLIFVLTKGVFLFGKSSEALAPSGTLTLIVLWLGISVPLIFLGSMIGYKKQAIQNPCKFNSTERPIESQPCWSNSIILCILGGLLPFGALFIELVFVMMSIWRHAFYYLYLFLFICTILLAITSAETSIVLTYYKLSRGNHKVWWSSFLGVGSTGLYLFAYSIFYFMTELEITDLSSSLLYFGSMLAISLFFSLFCGSIGFFASYWFTRKIYGTIRTNDQIELDEQKSPEYGYETFVEDEVSTV